MFLQLGHQKSSRLSDHICDYWFGLDWKDRIGKVVGGNRENCLFEICACSPEMYEHLLEFDTSHDCRPVNFDRNESSITIKNPGIPVDDERKIADLPLDGFDIVIDCAATLRTGKAQRLFCCWGT